MEGSSGLPLSTPAALGSMIMAKGRCPPAASQSNPYACCISDPDMEALKGVRTLKAPAASSSRGEKKRRRRDGTDCDAEVGMDSDGTDADDDDAAGLIHCTGISDGFFVCPDDACGYAVCPSCLPLATRLRGTALSFLYQVSRFGFYPFLGAAILVVVQSVQQPLLLSALQLINCDSRFWCYFPTCYHSRTAIISGASSSSNAIGAVVAVVPVSAAYITAVCIAIVAALMVGVALPAYLLWHLVCRRRLIAMHLSSSVSLVRPLLDSPRGNANMTTPNDATTATAKHTFHNNSSSSGPGEDDGTAWERMFLADRSLLRALYASFDYHLMWMYPIGGALKLSLVFPVVFAAQNSLTQLAAVSALECAHLLFWLLANPFTQPWIGFLTYCGSIHQLGQLSLIAFNRAAAFEYHSTVAPIVVAGSVSEGGDTSSSFSSSSSSSSRYTTGMQWLFVAYLLVILVVVCVTVVVPAVVALVVPDPVAGASRRLDHIRVRLAGLVELYVTLPEGDGMGMWRTAAEEEAVASDEEGGDGEAIVGGRVGPQQPSAHRPRPPAAGVLWSQRAKALIPPTWHVEKLRRHILETARTIDVDVPSLSSASPPDCPDPERDSEAFAEHLYPYQLAGTSIGSIGDDIALVRRVIGHGKSLWAIPFTASRGLRYAVLAECNAYMTSLERTLRSEERLLTDMLYALSTSASPPTSVSSRGGAANQKEERCAAVGVLEEVIQMAYLSSPSSSSLSFASPSSCQHTSDRPSSEKEDGAGEEEPLRLVKNSSSAVRFVFEQRRAIYQTCLKRRASVVMQQQQQQHQRGAEERARRGRGGRGNRRGGNLGTDAESAAEFVDSDCDPSPFIRIIRRSLLHTVRYLASPSSSPSSPSPSSSPSGTAVAALTPEYVAKHGLLCQATTPEMVALLHSLYAGADPKILDVGAQWTRALFDALSGAGSGNDGRLAALNSSADINRCASPAFIKALLATGGCDLNARNADGFTPLHVAVRGGHLAAVRLLVGAYRAQYNAEGAADSSRGGGGGDTSAVPLSSPSPPSSMNRSRSSYSPPSSCLFFDINAYSASPRKAVASRHTALGMACEGVFALEEEEEAKRKEKGKGESHRWKGAVAAAGGEDDDEHGFLCMHTHSNNRVEVLKCLLAAAMIPSTVEEEGCRSGVERRDLDLANNATHHHSPSSLRSSSSSSRCCVVDVNKGAVEEDGTAYSPLYVACERGSLVVLDLLLSTLVEGGGGDAGGGRGGPLIPLDVNRGAMPCDGSECDGGDDDDDAAVNANANDSPHIGDDGTVALLQSNTAHITNSSSHKRSLAGTSPLYKACQKGHTEVVRRLLLLLPPHDASSPSVASRLDVNRGLLFEDGVRGCTPLFAAARNGHAAIVRLLLLCSSTATATHATDPNRLLPQPSPSPSVAAVDHMCVDEFGVTRTAFHVACQHGHADVVSAFFDCAHSSCRLDVNALSVDPSSSLSTNRRIGRSPLFVACEYGRTAVVKLFADYHLAMVRMRQEKQQHHHQQQQGIAMLVDLHHGRSEVFERRTAHSESADETAHDGCGAVGAVVHTTLISISPLFKACEKKGSAEMVKQLLRLRQPDAANPAAAAAAGEGGWWLDPSRGKSTTTKEEVVVGTSLPSTTPPSVVGTTVHVTPLELATAKGHAEIVNLLLTPPHLAHTAEGDAEGEEDAVVVVPSYGDNAAAAPAPPIHAASSVASFSPLSRTAKEEESLMMVPPVEDVAGGVSAPLVIDGGGDGGGCGGNGGGNAAYGGGRARTAADHRNHCCHCLRQGAVSSRDIIIRTVLRRRPLPASVIAGMVNTNTTEGSSPSSSSLSSSSFLSLVLHLAALQDYPFPLSLLFPQPSFPSSSSSSSSALLSPNSQPNQNSDGDSDGSVVVIAAALATAAFHNNTTFLLSCAPSLRCVGGAVQYEEEMTAAAAAASSRRLPLLSPLYWLLQQNNLSGYRRVVRAFSLLAVAAAEEEEEERRADRLPNDPPPCSLRRERDNARPLLPATLAVVDAAHFAFACRRGHVAAIKLMATAAEFSDFIDVNACRSANTANTGTTTTSSSSASAFFIANTYNYEEGDRDAGGAGGGGGVVTSSTALYSAVEHDGGGGGGASTPPPTVAVVSTLLDLLTVDPNKGEERVEVKREERKKEVLILEDARHNNTPIVQCTAGDQESVFGAPQPPPTVAASADGPAAAIRVSTPTTMATTTMTTVLRSPLYLAVYKGNVAVVKLFLAAHRRQLSSNACSSRRRRDARVSVSLPRVGGGAAAAIPFPLDLHAGMTTTVTRSSSLGGGTTTSSSSYGHSYGHSRHAIVVSCGDYTTPLANALMYARVEIALLLLSALAVELPLSMGVGVVVEEGEGEGKGEGSAAANNVGTAAAAAGAPSPSSSTCLPHLFYLSPPPFPPLLPLDTGALERGGTVLTTPLYTACANGECIEVVRRLLQIAAATTTTTATKVPAHHHHDAPPPNAGAEQKREQQPRRSFLLDVNRGCDEYSSFVEEEEDMVEADGGGESSAELLHVPPCASSDEAPQPTAAAAAEERRSSDDGARTMHATNKGTQQQKRCYIIRRRSPLHIACLYGNVATVRLLLEAAAGRLPMPPPAHAAMPHLIPPLHFEGAAHHPAILLDLDCGEYEEEGVEEEGGAAARNARTVPATIRIKTKMTVTTPLQAAVDGGHAEIALMLRRAIACRDSAAAAAAANYHSD